jgi:hypothetical protein
MVIAPLLTCKLELVFETLRNNDLILVIWQDDPLSTIHAPMSSNSAKLFLERKVARENSFLNFSANSSISVDVVSATYASSSSFFFLGHWLA